MQDLAYKSKSTLITLSVSATVFVILDCVLAYYHPLIGGILALCALITLISCTCGVIGEITRPNVLITTDSDGSMTARCLYSAIGNGTKFPFRAYVPYPITAARS